MNRVTSLRYHTSRPVEKAFVPPRPLRAHVREGMHGKLLPSDLVSMGQSIPSGKIGVCVALFAVLVFAGEMVRAWL